MTALRKWGKSSVPVWVTPVQMYDILYAVTRFVQLTRELLLKALFVLPLYTLLTRCLLCFTHMYILCVTRSGFSSSPWTVPIYTYSKRSAHVHVSMQWIPSGHLFTLIIQLLCYWFNHVTWSGLQPIYDWKKDIFQNKYAWLAFKERNRCESFVKCLNPTNLHVCGGGSMLSVLNSIACTLYRFTYIISSLPPKVR